MVTDTLPSGPAIRRPEKTVPDPARPKPRAESLSPPDRLDRPGTVAGIPALVPNGDNLEEHGREKNTSYHPACQEYFPKKH